MGLEKLLKTVPTHSSRNKLVFKFYMVLLLTLWAVCTWSSGVLGAKFPAEKKKDASVSAYRVPEETFFLE